MFVCVCVCMRACACVCVCVYAHFLHTHRALLPLMHIFPLLTPIFYFKQKSAPLTATQGQIFTPPHFHVTPPLPSFCKKTGFMHKWPPHLAAEPPSRTKERCLSGSRLVSQIRRWLSVLKSGGRRAQIWVNGGHFTVFRLRVSTTVSTN